MTCYNSAKFEWGTISYMTEKNDEANQECELCDHNH